MKYENIVEGKFIQRKNRFIAEIEIGGQTHCCHVKNTGRCKELLLPGAKVYLQECDNPNRKTRYSLITVKKGERYINIDSQVPNKVFAQSNVLGADALIAEQTFEDSRFDFAITRGKQTGFVEVKGVTLEIDNVAYFPDAPTLRGIKHIHGLMRAREMGLLSFLIFIVQIDGIGHFSPNDWTHPAFGQALREAKAAGVSLLAYDCKVSPDSITLHKNIDIIL